jgi:uncharacterized protein related to proFAR isomerase
MNLVLLKVSYDFEYFLIENAIDLDKLLHKISNINKIHQLNTKKTEFLDCGSDKVL